MFFNESIQSASSLSLLIFDILAIYINKFFFFNIYIFCFSYLLQVIQYSINRHPPKYEINGVLII